MNYFKVLIRRLRAALQTHPAVHFDPLPFDGTVYRIDAQLEVSHDAADLLANLRTERSNVREAFRPVPRYLFARSRVSLGGDVAATLSG
ncbi:MAG: hypothetical protein HC933_01315 [Pleurocapsa sp. SU_196_0]|nr:hypothetical protein [Pleurocapsa sp. SU_196_0]